MSGPVGFSDAARAVAEQCSCLRSRRMSRVLTRLYDDVLRPSGLRMSQLSVLVAIARFGERGAQIGALADVLAIERTTLTRNIGPLEREGLLRVARDPADARARILLLTRAGERAIEAAFPLWQEAQRRVRDAVGRSQLDEFNAELTALLSAVSEHAGDAAPAVHPRRK
jgi:DNA-binding MarR family transcriptional regulator